MKQFKTESKKLLDLMINSIYTNKEIFLRELISNASDAVDKLYFKSLTDTSIEVDKEDLSIIVAFDKNARVITVSDNGIGMTKEELDKNLGTIAHSDSLDFKQALDDSDSPTSDVDIIGQFGVGFYSAFMVAQRVRVVSRAYGSDEAYEWESDGVEGYTVRKSSRENHGTDVILMLKSDTADEKYTEFLSEWGLRNLITKYSNYVRYPIKMLVTKEQAKPRPEDAPEDYKTEYEEYQELETINSMIPIWKRNKRDVSQEEYDEFYKSNFHDYTEPLRTIPIHAEGTLNYDALLFIPSRPPFDMYTRDYEKGLALYSSNVLIMDKCPELLPDAFNFVRGIVESQDLNLNISRETLQHNGQLHAIGRKIEKKIKAELVDMRDNDREVYEGFFENFGRSIKFGLYFEYSQNKDLLADLLLFRSAKEDKWVTLDEYIAAMPGHVANADAEGEDAEGEVVEVIDPDVPAQTAIYYAVGGTAEQLAHMPIVESVLSKGYDVLLLTEDVDEFCMQMMMEYKGQTFKNVAGGDLGLETEDEKAAAEDLTKQNEGLFGAVKEALSGKVTRVAVSSRLFGEAAAAACITADGPMSLEMERILREEGKDDGYTSKRVLELNPQHPVFEALRSAYEAGDTDKVALYAEVLYGSAVLVAGLPLDDPTAFAAKVAQLLK